MSKGPIQFESNADQVADELRAQLQGMRKNLKQQVFRALTVLEAEILQNLRNKSGLHVRSGALLNSVGASKDVKVVADNEVVGQIGSQGVPYARIHEFGGTTKPHIIRPRNAKALRFMGKGGETFAKFVNHPGSKIPARPYLSTALTAKKDLILQNFGVFLAMSFPKKG